MKLAGQRFGRLLAVEPLGINEKGKAVWRCKCDCGSEPSVVGAQMKYGDTLSCGCLVTSNLKDQRGKVPHYWSYRKMLHNSQIHAKSFDISFDDYLEFTKVSNCHYCRTTITWIPFRKRWQSSCYYIDRKDNSVGYTKNNCVVCCSLCNRIKGNNLSYDEMMLLRVPLGAIQQARVLKSNDITK